MQNCLQSKTRKILAALGLLCLFAVFAATFGQIAAHEKSVINQYESLRNTEESACFDENESPLPAKSDAAVLQNGQKMNNYEPKVAKIYSLSTKKDVMPDIDADFVRVLTHDGRVMNMELEAYVRGCVYGEMPLSFEPQALMAQSVAARTFAVNMINGTSKHKGADVCTSPACCQNFVDVKKEVLGNEKYKRLCDCVAATKGIVITFKGQPIEAVYHASSGERTLNSEDVWGGHLEYLRSVKAPDGEDAISVSGMGHRVGMSQHGANLLAKEGMGYTDILKYYYSGISFDFL